MRGHNICFGGNLCLTYPFYPLLSEALPDCDITRLSPLLKQERENNFELDFL